MSYALTVLDELYAWRTWLLVIAAVLLLDVLVLALLSRRYRASLTEWQIRTLPFPFPFIRLPDGGVQYVTPPLVVVLRYAVLVIIVGAALVLLFEGVVLLVEGLVLAQHVVGFLARGLRTLR
jgi:hypothetical protein